MSIGVLGHEQLESGTEYSSTSTSETVDDDDDDAYYESQGDQAQQGFTIFLLLVSLYWTSTVILVSARCFERCYITLTSKWNAVNSWAYVISYHCKNNLEYNSGDSCWCNGDVLL